MFLVSFCTAVSAASDIQYGQFEVTFTAAELLDQETIDTVSDFMDVDADIVWKMYVPETYDPNVPAGLMVYISPSQKGSMPRSWQPVMDDENLIWISANSSGNEEIVAKRKVSGMAAVNFANIFKGAIYICGAEYWRDHPPALFSEVKSNRYVFLTGSEDFNRDLTYRIYRKYESAGVSNIELINVPQMTHKNPDTRYFLKAINFLDQRE